MDTAFNPKTVEPFWRERWETLSAGRPDDDSTRPTFTIALPPPNVTGELHCGHAAGFSVQDILIRYHKMRGFDVEWCPGTDHAAIATQNVIERMLATEGTTKEEIGREAFDERVNKWYADYGGRIFEQMRRLGFLCDWSRGRFTLDPHYEKAIRIVFKQLYDDGLIYRGPRMVNWCPRCRSAISDEEVVWREHEDALYYIRYSSADGDALVIATVRPETLLGDSGIAVSPGDQRYQTMVGKTLRVPLTKRYIPVFEDAAVEPEFGTGVLKVTPAHDPTDYEIGKRHNLPVLSVITPEGVLDYPDIPTLHGLDMQQARTAIVALLENEGTLVKQEPYTHEVGHCDRCNNVIEPQISEQWWVKMEQLAQTGIASVTEGRVVFSPKRYEEMYLSWMRNIRDWCISRQLWLGHEIPVSTCANGHVFAWIEHPDSCPICASGNLVADPDVLDTWFSSALWPFAIFGWPDRTEDLARFYPTDVLVTAREIIPLWVARMVVTGNYFMKKEPFSEVIITGTIQATDGSRMSKSKGNVVNPLEMVDRYGADAVRAWAAAVGTSGQDVRFDESKIASYQKFANKIWQATRFLLARIGDPTTELLPDIALDEIDQLAIEDRWVLGEVAKAVETAKKGVESYHFNESIDVLYESIWHTFCDWYIELIKQRLPLRPNEGELTVDQRHAAATAVASWKDLLSALHPFMPFVTEACLQHFAGAPATALQLRWPEFQLLPAEELPQMQELLAFVQEIRAAAQSQQVQLKDTSTIYLTSYPTNMHKDEVLRLLRALFRSTIASDVGTATESRKIRVALGVYEAVIATPQETAVATENVEHLYARVQELTARIERMNQQLSNPGFVDKAPAAIVEKTRLQLQECEAEAQRLRQYVSGDK